jgi:hypothetical protein
MSEQPMLTGMGPHLNIAAICEGFSQDANGAITLFRIVDRFTVTGNTPQMPPTQISFKLVVSFRAGEYRGPLDLKLTMDSQSQAPPPMPEISVPLNFEAPDEKSANMIGNITWNVKEAGLYWIVVRLAEEERTRIPVRVFYQRQPTVQTGN